MSNTSSTTRIKIWIKVLSAFFQTFGGVKSNIYDAEDTVAEIIKGKSLIRFGDGEFGIYQGADIHYQPWSEALMNEFLTIKNKFEMQGSHCRFLLAVPKKYMQCSGAKLGKRRVLVSSWAQSRLFFKKRFDRTLTYGDSFLFEKKNKEIYSRIWQQPGDNRTIIFVHNNGDYAHNFAETYGREVIYVGCASYDAFSSVDRLTDDIIAAIRHNGIPVGGVQIVLSAGPAGKVVASRLSAIGYHCIDAGHCWDDPLES